MGKSGYLTGVIGGIGCTLALIGIALYLRSNDAAFRARALPAVATVVAHKTTERRDKDNNTRIDESDVYAYTSQTGVRTEFIQPNSALRPQRPIGESAPIFYDPNDLSDARLDDDAANRTSKLLMWSSPFGLVIAGIFFAVWRRSAT